MTISANSAVNGVNLGKGGPYNLNEEEKSSGEAE